MMLKQTCIPVITAQEVIISQSYSCIYWFALVLQRLLSLFCKTAIAVVKVNKKAIAINH